VDDAARQQAWRHGASLFDGGEFWECHEALEPAWLLSSGLEKRFLGGVILLAAALHKARRMGSARGGRRNYAKALAKLALVGDRFYGIDVRELEARVHEALREPTNRPAMPFLAKEAAEPHE
jgi:predicted metal-dependent hydrolase